jgi:hypothetical protein
MNLDRNGKIARLPKHLREELNRRLENGERGQPLLQWLNSRLEVRELMAAEFDGLPVNKQSLSQWRRGGYAEWLRQQETRDMAQQMITEAGEFQPVDTPPLTDRMAVWVTARYLLSVRRLTEQTGAEASDLPVLQEFCRDLVALRRGDHCAARLKMEQDRLSRRREAALTRQAASPPPDRVKPSEAQDRNRPMQATPGFPAGGGNGSDLPPAAAWSGKVKIGVSPMPPLHIP